MKTLIKSNNLIFILLILAISIMVAGGSFIYYQHEKVIFRDKKSNELEAIATLKVNQLVKWLEERRSEALFFSTNQPDVVLMQQLVEGAAGEQETQQLRNSLLRIMSNKRYENIFMLAENGDLLFSVNQIFDSVNFNTINFSNQVIKNNRIGAHDFYYCHSHKKVHYEIIAPVINSNNKVFASLVFQINPTDYLYPFLQDWPIQSKTAESLIVRKDSNRVVFLNPLRHDANKTLSVWIPITKSDVPAVMAVLGFTGMVEGIDYRNQKVLAIINKVPNTPWFMISKVDQKELYEQLYKNAFLIGLLALLSILLAVVAAVWVNHYRQRNIYRELYNKKLALHESQEEFRTILYSLSDGVITTDKNGLIKQLNPAAEKLTGWFEKDAMGKPLDVVFQIIHEKTREKIENPATKVLNDGIVVKIANETLLISKNGAEIPISDSSAPILNSNKEVIGVVLIFSNQTFKRQQQKVIKESEEKHRMLITQMQLGLAVHEMIFDKNGNAVDYLFVDINPAFEKLTGLNRETVIGKKILDILPNTEKIWIERYSEVLRTGEPVSFENFAKELGKYYRVLAYRYRKNLFAVIIEDITEHKKLEHELRASEERKRSYFVNATYGIFITDKSGKYLEVNPVACKITAYTEAELLTMRVSDLIPPEGMEAGVNHFNTLLNTGYAFGEFQFYTKNGDKRWWTISAKKISEDLYLGFCDDITERKNTEENLKANYELLKIAGETSKFGGWRMNYEESKVVWSDEVAAIHEVAEGYAPSIEEGLNYYKPEYREKLVHVLENCLKSGEPFDEEAELITAKGNRRWVKVIGKAVKNNNKQIIEVFGSIQDISKIKQAEFDLEQSQLAIARLIDNLSGIAYRCRFDENYTMEFISQGCEIMTGYTDNDFYSGMATWNELIEEADREMIREQISNSLACNDYYQIEYRISHRNGKTRWFWEKGCGVYDENHKVIALEGFITDFTEQKKAKDELIALKNSLEINIQEKTKELNERIIELERFRDATIDRELRIKELRDQIENLKRTN